MGAARQKQLLLKYNHARLQRFKVDDEATLVLPAPPSLPGFAASTRLDVFKKEAIGLSANSQIKYIKKNGASKSFVWETSGRKIKEAVRWGIIKTESVTDKVISALGHYRVIEHERIVRGLISNSHLSKIALVELHQRRFEALQDLESLVNKPNTLKDFQDAIKAYKQKLDDLKAQLRIIFQDTLFIKDMDNALVSIEQDLDEAKKRADAYLKELTDRKVSLRSCSRASGNHSILEFVKNDMLRGLYEMQGLNQDLTYISTRREVALSRGELNSCIEDAIKEINDFRPDLRNAVLPEHHGQHGNPDEKVCYDFEEQHLTPEQERRAFLAISFIEGCDKVIVKQGEKPKIESLKKGRKDNQRDLKIIAATSWHTTRSYWDSFTRFGHTIARMFKSFIIPTRQWDGKPWSAEYIINKDGERVRDDFTSNTSLLRKRAKKQEPLWKKPWHLLKLIGNNLIDMVKGIRDMGANLTINVPSELTEDWDATGKTDSWLRKSEKAIITEETRQDQQKKLAKAATKQERKKLEHAFEQEMEEKRWKAVRDVIDRNIKQIKVDDKENEDALFTMINIMIVKNHKKKHPTLFFNRGDVKKDADKLFPRLSGFQYHLTGGEQNDILSSIARGLNDFANVITHNIYAKQPVPGLIFTLVYIAGGAAILTPELLKALGPFADALINFYNTIAPALGKSPISQAGSVSLSTAQLVTTLVESIINGPNSWLANALDEFCNDPATALAYIAAAYGLGYVITNGIGPLKIEAIQDFFKDELGSMPSVSYPVVGGKVGILFIEFFMSHKQFFLSSVSFKKQQKDIQELENKIVEIYNQYAKENPEISAGDNLGETLSAKRGQHISRVINQALVKAIEFFQSFNMVEFQKRMAKIKLATWLAHQREYLPRLSSREKSAVERRIKSVFSYEEAASLIKLIYPEKPRSIAYQLFAIPLSYVPAILRVLISPFISLAAVCDGRTGKGYHPAAPMKNAVVDLYHKSRRDLSRLLVFGKEVAKLVYTVTASLLKMPVVIVGMIVGRIAGMFGFRVSHGMYKVFGAIHVFGRKVMEFFNPGRALKAETIAHENDTLNKVKLSYETILSYFPKEEKKTPIISKPHCFTQSDDSSDEEVDREAGESEVVPLDDETTPLLDISGSASKVPSMQV